LQDITLISLFFTCSQIKKNDDVYRCVYFFHDTLGSLLMQSLINYQY